MQEFSMSIWNRINFAKLRIYLLTKFNLFWLCYAWCLERIIQKSTFKSYGSYFQPTKNTLNKFSFFGSDHVLEHWNYKILFDWLKKINAWYNERINFNFMFIFYKLISNIITLQLELFLFFDFSGQIIDFNKFVLLSFRCITGHLIYLSFIFKHPSRNSST